ncbi:MAG: glycosyltransferase family 2 protein, partial [Acidobacteriota bacterium]|nr:glycosyltransferase family 2 protein [Acidobacteriota bacterium]
IPTHNRPHLLPRVVDSARQSGKDVEVIVVDDASTDSTADVCNKLKDIKYIRLDRNQGVAGARNVGILASNTEFIAFLDDDDLRLPGSLDVQIEALEANPKAGFVCGECLHMDQDYNVLKERTTPPSSGDVFWEILEMGFPVLPLSVVIRKSRLFSSGLFNTRCSGFDDWDLWVRLAELFPVALVNEPVGIYRIPTPGSNQGLSIAAPLFLRVVRHQSQLLMLPRAQAAPQVKRREARRRLRKRIADTLSWTAATMLPEGQYEVALVNFLAAVRISPTSAARPAHARQMYRSFMAQRKAPPRGAPSPT